ncbi:MAG: TraB/GumN family protein [Pseudomonadota bacterium]
MTAKKLKKLFFLLLLILCACAGRPGRAEAGSDRHFLWKVQDGPGVVFLLGSVHLAPRDLYPLDAALEDAYRASERLVVEADINSVDHERFQALIMSGAVYPEGDGVENHLSAKTKDKISASGLDLAAFGRSRPWLIAITLQAERLHALGFEEKFGLDQHFLDRARKDGTPILELESVDYQINLFLNLTEREQDMFLYETLVELDHLEGMVAGLVQAWRVGDEDGFTKIFFKGYQENPELWPLADKIIFDRNRDMADKIAGFLAGGGNSLVIVGAAHLVGERGLLELLRQRGARVEQW